MGRPTVAASEITKMAETITNKKDLIIRRELDEDLQLILDKYNNEAVRKELLMVQQIRTLKLILEKP